MLPELLARRHPVARHRAILETGLPENTFPEHCPFSLDEFLDPDYWT